MNKQILAIGYYHHGEMIIMTNSNITQTNIQYREIAIASLPEACYVKYKLQGWVKDASKASIFVVAKIGVSGDWTVYTGYPNINDVSDELKHLPSVEYHCTNFHHMKSVLMYGDVLDQQSAEMIFPEWKYMRYRT